MIAALTAVMLLAGCGGDTGFPDATSSPPDAPGHGELIVLAAPRDGDPYYADAAQDIFDFHVTYAQQVALHEWWVSTEQLPPCRADAPVTLVGDSAVRFCGYISRESIEALIEVLSSADRRTLVFSSTGGEMTAAIRLADFLRTHEIRLQIVGACMSACAQYVIFGAPQLFVAERTVVGFHHSQVAMNAMRDIALAEVPWDSEAIALKELQFYARHTVPEALLLEPVHARGLICVVRPKPDDPPTSILFRAVHRYVMPDETTFRRLYSGELKSAWPDELEIREHLNQPRLLPLKNEWRLKYGEWSEVDSGPLRATICEK